MGGIAASPVRSDPTMVAAPALLFILSKKIWDLIVEVVLRPLGGGRVLGYSLELLTIVAPIKSITHCKILDLNCADQILYVALAFQGECKVIGRLDGILKTLR